MWSRAALDPAVSDTASSRLFMNIIADIEVELHLLLLRFRKVMDQLVSKYATRLLKVRL